MTKCPVGANIFMHLAPFMKYSVAMKFYDCRVNGWKESIMVKESTLFLTGVFTKGNGWKIGNRNMLSTFVRMHGSGSFTDIVSGAQFRGQFYNNSGPGLQAWLM